MIEGKDRERPGACFSKELFESGKLFCVCRVCIQNQSFHNFKNYTLKLSVNKEKLTDLCAGNSSHIQQLLT